MANNKRGSNDATEICTVCAVVFVFNNDKLIGMGRALCDGEYNPAINGLILE